MTAEPKAGDIVKMLDAEARKRSGWVAACVTWGGICHQLRLLGSCAGMATLNHGRCGIRLDCVLLSLAARGRWAPAGIACGSRLEVPLVIPRTALARAKRPWPTEI